MRGDVKMSAKVSLKQLIDHQAVTIKLFFEILGVTDLVDCENQGGRLELGARRPRGDNFSFDGLLKDRTVFFTTEFKFRREKGKSWVYGLAKAKSLY